MQNKITISNLPNLGIEPLKRFDENSFLTDVFYSLPSGSTISISFDEEGDVSQMAYNGNIIPNNSLLDLIDGNLHITIPSA